MALADLATWKEYESELPYEVEAQNHDDVFARKAKASGARLMFLERDSPQFEGISRKLNRLQLQARPPVTEALATSANRPSIEWWVTITISVTVLLSVAITVIAFFIFLLEVSAGRSAFLAPSFSALFIFSIVGLVAFRLKRAVAYFQSDRQPL